MSDRTKSLRTVFSRAVTALAGVLALGATTGCNIPLPWGGYDDGSGSALGRHSEAVVVDYYKGSTKVRSCAGTLLSKNVVIAPAHCADGTTKAVVAALDTKRTRTTVSRVYTYDWTSADPSMVRSQRHDVALLVTRKAIEEVRYAKVQSKPCGSCTVLSIGRSRTDSGRVLSISKKLQYTHASSVTDPTRIGLRTSRVTNRGGAVYRLTKSSSDRVIVGLVIGRTKSSGSTVAVPLTNPVMQDWIRAVVSTEGKILDAKAKVKAKSSLSSSSLRFLSDDEEPSTEESSSSSSSSSGGEEASSSSSSSGEDTTSSGSEGGDEKVDDESASNGAPSADPAPSEDDSTKASDPETKDEPVTDDAPTDDPQKSADETPSKDDGTQPSADDTTKDDTTKDEDKPSTGASSEDPLVPSGDTKEEPQSSPDTQAKEDPTKSEETPTTSDPSGFDESQKSPTEDTKTEDPKTDDSAVAPTTKDGNETLPPLRGSIPGVAPLKAPASSEETTEHPTGNAVTVAKPDDPAFKDDAKLAERYQGVANVYNSHGMPGTLVGGVPREDMERFLKDDKPLIVASCFSGAPTQGGSTIRRVASTYSDDPSVASRIYGCTGFASGDEASGIGCTGAWVDGNGRAVPSSERDRLGLNQYRCNVNTLDDDYKPVWKDCQSAD